MPRMGAALSFYTLFSLAPLAILTLSLVSLAIERSAARAEMIEIIRYQIGNEGADTISGILAKTAAASTSPWEAVVGFIVLLIGSSSVFGELQDSLNQIWNVTPQRHPLLGMIKKRVISFVIVLVLSLFMVLSFLFSAAFAVAGSYLHDKLPRLDGAWELANSVVSLLVIAMLFGLIYRFIPDARITWRDVVPGAAIAAVLFVIGKYVLGFYFGRSAIASSYGPAGSVIIVLLWVYYSAQIMLFGAEFSRVYAQRFGSHRDDEAQVGVG